MTEAVKMRFRFLQSLKRSFMASKYTCKGPGLVSQALCALLRSRLLACKLSSTIAFRIKAPQT